MTTGFIEARGVSSHLFAQGKSAVIYEVSCHKDTLALACGTSAFAEAFRPVVVELIFRSVPSWFAFAMRRFAEMRFLFLVATGLPMSVDRRFSASRWLEKQHDVVFMRTGRQMRILETEPDLEAVAKAAAAVEGVPSSLVDQLLGLGKPDKPPQRIGAGPRGVVIGSPDPPGDAKPKKALVQEVEPPASTSSCGLKPALESEVAQEADGTSSLVVVVTIAAPEGLRGSDFDVDVSACNRKLLIGETTKTRR
jgi:hypothetical protein